MKTKILIVITFIIGLLIGQSINNSNKEVEFVWNDDFESIPVDNSKIVIEFTEGNIIYLGTVEANE